VAVEVKDVALIEASKSIVASADIFEVRDDKFMEARRFTVVEAEAEDVEEVAVIDALKEL